MTGGLALPLSLGILAASFTSAAASKITSCESGFFFQQNNKGGGICRKCSVCPRNQIIKIPCKPYSDLECSPFVFTEDQGFSPDLQVYANSIEFEDFNKLNGLSNDNYDKSLLGNGHAASTDRDGPTTVEREDREYWKTLAFALIGLLSVLIIVATIAVLLACRKLQHVTVIKQPEDGDLDDADSGYVVIRAIRNLSDGQPTHPDQSLYTREDMSAHPPLLAPGSLDSYPFSSAFDPSTYPYQPAGRLCFLPKVYKPQRRLLNYDTDDVFESDDSGNSLQRSKLQTIAENSVSSSRKASDTNKSMDKGESADAKHL